MMVTARGSVTTPNADKYLRQLCKHAAHEFEVTTGDGHGTIEAPQGKIELAVQANELSALLTAEEAGLARLKERVQRHLDRFAFRELPLPFAWEEMKSA